MRLTAVEISMALNPSLFRQQLPLSIKVCNYYHYLGTCLFQRMGCNLQSNANKEERSFLKKYCHGLGVKKKSYLLFQPSNICFHGNRSEKEKIKKTTHKKISTAEIDSSSSGLLPLPVPLPWKQMSDQSTQGNGF